MPPAAVSVIELKAQPLPVVNDLPGRVAATQSADVRPQVSGIIKQRVFKQGSLVKQGDVLYRIDPASFQLQLESAKATLQRAQAAQLLARQQADREKQLAVTNVASTQDLDSAIAALAQADADVASGQAAVDSAQLNLQYADVKAPISGRIGSALITEGALVSSTGTDTLATIQQLDPVYADFTESASDLLRLKQLVKTGQLESPGDGQATVHLLFDDGTEYSKPGTLLFSESTVDQTTGQIVMRAQFPNPDDDLLPGMYIRVRIEQAIDKAALVVPEQAIQHDVSGNAQVYLVDAKNVASLQKVQVGRTEGDNVVITSGLKSGDHVIVEGFQKLRPGATVAPSEWKPAPAPAANSNPQG